MTHYQSIRAHFSPFHHRDLRKFSIITLVKVRECVPKKTERINIQLSAYRLGRAWQAIKVLARI